MDPLIMSFTFKSDADPSALDRGLESIGAEPVRHWQVGNTDYVVVGDVPGWEELDRAVDDVEASVTGAARLVIEHGPRADPADLEAALPDELTEAIDLPRVSSLVDQAPLSPEKFICAACGGIGSHAPGCGFG